MGIRKFLSQLIEPEDPTVEDDTPRARGTGDAQGEHRDSNVVRALADVVRAVGEGCFDMDGETAEAIQDRFNELARQVDVADDAALAALSENVAAHRRHERHWVSKNVRDIAETVVGLVTRLGRNVTLDRASDSRVENQLRRLKGAAEQPDLASMRNEVLSAVETIAEAMKERDERQRSEMAAISRQLESLRNELTHTRKEMAMDGLTRLYNRASLDEHMESVVSISALSGRDACLLMVDIDHFKAVNDTWGHQAGDAVLRAVADLLVKCFPRRSDFVGRYGGEEFVVVLGEDGAATGRMLAQRLLERVRGEIIPWDGQEIRLTVSIGIAAFADGDGVKEWVARADKALYDAKSGGRDQAVEADPSR